MLVHLSPLHRPIATFASPHLPHGTLTHPPIRSFIGPPAPGGYRDGNFVFELCATECLVEMQILIQEFADIKSEAHESYEVRVSYMAME